MKQRVTAPSRCARRRGSALVLVLGVTSIVGVIGLSSLLAVRLQHRDVQSRSDAAQAQQLADGALQLIHARLCEDPNWRTTYTHDTWSSDETLGDASTLNFKLQDEDDADLADDDNDPAHLIVRVAHGDAVRLASVQVTTVVTLGPEIVTNGDMEDGTTGYDTTDGIAFFNLHTSDPHNGDTALELRFRNLFTVGWKQDLPTTAIESGKTYRVSVWLKLKDSSAGVTVGLYQAPLLLFSADTAATDTGSTEWKELSADLTPSFSFTPVTSYVYCRTTTGIQNIYFDDLSIREVSDTSVGIVRGSYRRELDD